MYHFYFGFFLLWNDEILYPYFYKNNIALIFNFNCNFKCNLIQVFSILLIVINSIHQNPFFSYNHYVVCSKNTEQIKTSKNAYFQLYNILHHRILYEYHQPKYFRWKPNCKKFRLLKNLLRLLEILEMHEILEILEMIEMYEEWSDLSERTASGLYLG